MQRSIAARFSGRPIARYTAAAAAPRGARLGLHHHASFRAAPQGFTFLRAADTGPVALLHADWRSMTAVRHHDPAGGPMAHVRWAKLGARSTGRRPRAASAPWRA